MKEESHHNRSYAKGYHKRSQALETVHFLEGQSYENEDEAISGVSHAKCEEQQEEYGNEGSGVEAVVCWTSVHVREDLEHLDKLVVLEADWRIVLHLCIFLDVEEPALVKFGRNFLFLFSGSVAYKGDKGVFCGGCGSATCKIEVQL